jgi:hypothetical protein
MDEEQRDGEHKKVSGMHPGDYCSCAALYDVGMKLGFVDFYCSAKPLVGLCKVLRLREAISVVVYRRRKEGMVRQGGREPSTGHRRVTM